MQGRKTRRTYNDEVIEQRDRKVRRHKDEAARRTLKRSTRELAYA